MLATDACFTGGQFGVVVHMCVDLTCDLLSGLVGKIVCVDLTGDTCRENCCVY